MSVLRKKKRNVFDVGGNFQERFVGGKLLADNA